MYVQSTEQSSPLNCWKHMQGGILQQLRLSLPTVSSDMYIVE